MVGTSKEGGRKCCFFCKRKLQIKQLPNILNEDNADHKTAMVIINESFSKGQRFCRDKCRLSLTKGGDTFLNYIKKHRPDALAPPGALALKYLQDITARQLFFNKEVLK